MYLNVAISNSINVLILNVIYHDAIIRYHTITGASLSEPHTSSESSDFLCMYIYIYIYSLSEQWNVTWVGTGAYEPPQREGAFN